MERHKVFFIKKITVLCGLCLKRCGVKERTFCVSGMCFSFTHASQNEEFYPLQTFSKIQNLGLQTLSKIHDFRFIDAFQNSEFQVSVFLFKYKHCASI